MMYCETTLGNIERLTFSWDAIKTIPLEEGDTKRG